MTIFFFSGREEEMLVPRHRENGVQELIAQDPMRVVLAADCRKLCGGKSIREALCDCLRMLRIGWNFDFCPVFDGTVAWPQELLAATLVRAKRIRNFASSLRLVGREIPAGRASAECTFGFIKE